MIRDEDNKEMRKKKDIHMCAYFSRSTWFF